LTPEEVLRIHEILCRDFLRSNDPINPPGVREMSLLESAVGRQHAGWGPFTKHSHPIDNAATLTYGLCNDHPFHNGNKRTALVAMLAHLDANKLALRETNQNDLYRMMLSVATHSLGQRRLDRRQRRKVRTPPRSTSDQEVRAISRWLEPRVVEVKRGEREITYKQLDRILQRFGYHLAVPQKNSIGIYKMVRKRGLLRGESLEPKRIGKVGFPGEGRVVGVPTVKQVRRMCRLTEEDGIDTVAFYEGADAINVFVNKYRTVLRRLAKQ
jgi:death-on-curing family protein